MTKGQRHLLKLLKEIDQICKENDIQYFSAGGTLIGALRHRGFVPWDDDADLYMTRDNFLKFLEVAKANKLPPNRMLGCQELDRRYCNSFARYVDTSATAIHRAQLIADDIAGEVIDIFQLDPIPADKSVQKKHFKRLLVYSELLNLSAPYLHRSEDGRLMYFYYKSLARIIGTERVLQLLEKKMFSYSEKECEHYFMRWGGAPLVFEKEMFKEVSYANCEDVEVLIPKHYNDYLVYHYGDEWCEVPNVSEQMSHEAVRCLGISYEHVKKTYWSAIDKRVIAKANAKSKSSRIRTAKDKHLVADKLASLRGVRVAEELKYRINEEKINLRQMYDNNQYSELMGIFAEYYGWQGHSQVAGRDTFGAVYRYLKPILIELPMPILEVALLTQLDVGRVAKVYRTIEIYEKNKGVLPQELEVIKQTITVLRKASTEYTVENYEKALQLVNCVLSSHPKIKPAIILKAKCLFKLEASKDEINTIISLGLSIFPQDTELKKLKSDLLYSGDKKRLYKEYEKIEGNVVNGFTRLDIEDCRKAYLDILYQEMEKAEQEGDISKIKEIYSEISTFRISEKEKLRCAECLLRSDMSKKEAYKLYKEIKGFGLLEEDIECTMSLCRKLLLLAGEAPQVADVHVKMLFVYDKEIVKEQIAKVQSDFKENKDIFYQLQKYYADILCEEGSVKAAYKEYLACIRNVETNSVVYKELCDMLQKDIHQIEYLKRVGADEMLNKNVIVKFGTEEVYEEYKLLYEK